MWFEKFHARDFLLDDAPQSGRSAKVDSDQIEMLVENNKYTTWEIASILKYPNLALKNICTILVMLIALMVGFFVN